jgi:hypothetical protein
LHGRWAYILTSNSLTYSNILGFNRYTIMSNQLRNLTALFGLKFRAQTWCALVTVLSFITLVSVSATHYHSTAHETQDCSICSVVTDKVGSGFSAPAPAVTQFFALFALATVILRSTLINAALPLPPSCGPPVSN